MWLWSAPDVGGLDEVGQGAVVSGLHLTHVFAQFRRNIGQVEVSVDGRLVRGSEGERCRFHALEFTCFRLGDEPEFVETKATVNGALAHRNVVLLAACEVGQRERFHVRRDDSDLSVDGAPGFQLFVVVAADGVQNVGVDVTNRERVVEDAGVEDEADL